MNAFKKRLLAGERLVGYEVDLCDPCICEMVGQAGFDYIWIDTEHSAMDYHTVLMQIIAAKAGGAASVVRIPWNEPYLAKRVLEMGPDGIIFPQVSSAEELKKAMDACLYHLREPGASDPGGPAATAPRTCSNTSKRPRTGCAASPRWSTWMPSTTWRRC